MPRPRLRRTPYTERGIRRVTCSMKGCRRKGYASWQVCADGGAYRAFCWLHDIAMNRLVLEWIGARDAERKLAAHAAKVIRSVNAA